MNGVQRDIWINKFSKAIHTILAIYEKKCHACTDVNLLSTACIALKSSYILSLSLNHCIVFKQDNLITLRRTRLPLTSVGVLLPLAHPFKSEMKKTASFVYRIFLIYSCITFARIVAAVEGWCLKIAAITSTSHQQLLLSQRLYSCILGT